MDETRVLIVDDELPIRSLLRVALAPAGFKLMEAETGASGLAKAATFHPHLIILDLGLPDMSGYDVLKSLRQWTEIPILILTVSDDEATKVKLLDHGADDYLTKPFGVPELMARIRVSLRNRRAVEATPFFKSGDLEIDLNARSVKVSSTEVKLTTTEFEFLKVLVRGNGRVVPQNEILKSVWGPRADQSHYLRIYVGQLRKKIEVDPAHPRHLLTEPGVGYRLV